MRERIRNLEEENSHLLTSNNQIKLLLEQTEFTLSEYKEKVSNTENHVTHTEQIIQKLEKERISRDCELSSLRNEIGSLKSSKSTYDKEKDRLIEDLDRKSEKIYQLESDIDTMRATKRSLEDTISRLQIQLKSINSENVHRQKDTKANSEETESLKKQIMTLKKTSDNALNENRRLVNELADTVTELNKEMKNTQKAISDKEQLKKEIQQYVIEVERVNALLVEKEATVFTMVESYQSATRDADCLRQTEGKLTNDATKLRYELYEANKAINNLKEELNAKGDITLSYERQISVMSAKIATLENESEELRTEVIRFEKTVSEIQIEKEKLLMEMTQLRQITRDIESEKIVHVDSESSSIQDLLTQKSYECERIRLSATHMSQEVVRLKCKVDELNGRLDEEHALAVKSEALAKEYKVQVQELRRLLTDDRYTQLRSFEDPNPYPTL